MMREIGVRELKANASKIMRNIRKRRSRYLITYRGRPVGLLTPLDVPAPPTTEADTAWAELMRLGEELARGWPAGKTSAEYLSEMQR